MDKEKILRLEEFAFSNVNKKDIAAHLVADVIGVLVDLKPVMMTGFAGGEIEHPAKLVVLLEELGLKVVIFYRKIKIEKSKVMVLYFFVSKKKSLAQKTLTEFFDLWKNMGKDDKPKSQKKWKKQTKKIGELLGYPKTAVEEFIMDIDVEDEERQKRMKRNRYYAHSKEHEDEEYEAYDKKLNEAVQEYAPKTTAQFMKNKAKKWL
jgi:hypothetical protein